ncbi:MAG: undecaprenyl-phosphate galactose phosphotransferase WbaP [Mitsuokella sp.]
MQIKAHRSGSRYKHYVYPLVLLLADYVGIILAEHSARVVHHILSVDAIASYTISAPYFYLWVPLVFILFLIKSRCYEAMCPVFDAVRDVFYALLYGFIACIAMLYFFSAAVLVSGLFMGLFFAFVFAFVYGIRYLVWKVMKIGHFFYEPIILIGAGLTAERLLRFYDGDLTCRYDVAGLIDDSPLLPRVAKQFLLYGKLDEAGNIIRDSGVQTVLIAAPGLEKGRLTKLIVDIQPYVRNISFVPDLIGTPLMGVEARTLFSEEMLVLRVRNNLARRRNRVFKRGFDLVFAIGGGLLISPILLILFLVVAYDNKGNVIFAHRRVGKNGRPFPCYKFQTMIPNAQEVLETYLAANPEARKEWEDSFKLTNDPRVTKLGSFLRRTSLDELPQLWNVIRGDMSLVGPRPIVEKEIQRYGESFREYKMVLPGITGMWQASGRSDTTYEERVEMDTWYVRNWSVWVDLMYLFKTVKAVFCGKGAY